MPVMVVRCFPNNKPWIINKCTGVQRGAEEEFKVGQGKLQKKAGEEAATLPLERCGKA